MTEIVTLIETISGLIFLASFFVMDAYLYRAKIYTAWRMGVNPLWPRIIFEYRDHTKKYSGKIGIWYFISKTSFFILLGAFIASIMPQLFSLPTPIAIIVLIVGGTVIPAIGYAIYGLSKEKYF
jgi:hypothetical protein